MGLIPNDLINQVLERTDIADIISNYTALKKSGRNFKALCPFHHEKTASFVVNPDKQIFHCFGCNVGGNVIGFLMRQEHMEFPVAVRFLAHKAGVGIPELQSTPLSPTQGLREEILRVNTLAAIFFHEILLTRHDPDTRAARDYLKGRGIDLETVKKFQLGFAPNEWDALLKSLKSKGVSDELMHQAGLIIAREGNNGFYDRFRHRIIFPIMDVQNRTVAFGARAMADSDGAKYVNSPQTAVYTKGQHMFGLNLTKSMVAQKDRIIVVEGYMDMIMPFAHGVDHIAASLGTALTVEQIRLIRRYTDNVVMLFDTDSAGQSAIVRSLDLLIDQQMNVRVATLAKDEDPDSFIRKQGLEAFNARIACAQTVLDFKFDWLKAQYDPLSIEGKSKISQELLAMIARFKSEVSKYELTKALARKLDIPESVLLKQSVGMKKEQEVLEEPEDKIKPPASITAGQELLLALFLKDSAWVKSAMEQISLDDFPDGNIRQIVSVMWSLAQEKNEWNASDILVRLSSPEDQSLVTRLMSIEEGKLKDPDLVFGDCIGKILKEKHKKVRGQLIEAIRQAQASQDTQKLDQLLEQFNQLIKI